MLRFLTPAVILVGGAVVRGDDTVQFRDRATKGDKVASVTGTVTGESIAGVKVKPNVGAERTVPATDVVDVIYQVPGGVRLTYNTALQHEAKKAVADAEREYAAVATQLRKDETTARIHRHLQYKLALLKVAQAAGDKVKLLEAADVLGKFRLQHPDSWQHVPCAKLQAQILTDLERFDDAAKVFDQLAANPDLPKPAKQEAELLAIDVLMRAKSFAVASQRVAKAIAALPANDPQAERLKIYQVGCDAPTADLAKVEPQLKASIDRTTDPSLKALAYNTLGDVYLAKGRPKDAQWAYLWVDAVYSADRAEHLKALERLAQVFKDLGDEDHAAKYRDKLMRLR